MKKLFILFSLILCSNITFATPLKIKALVNGEIISSEDIQNRINLFLMNSRIPYNSQTKDMINQRVLNNTVEEKLKLQEAAKEGIIISEKETKEQVAKFANNNKIPLSQLSLLLKQSNVNQRTIEEQLKSDLAWLRLIRKKYYSEGSITQKEINQALESAKKDLETPKYFANLTFDTPNSVKTLLILLIKTSYN